MYSFLEYINAGKNNIEITVEFNNINAIEIAIDLIPGTIESRKNSGIRAKTVVKEEAITEKNNSFTFFSKVKKLDDFYPVSVIIKDESAINPNAIVIPDKIFWSIGKSNIYNCAIVQITFIGIITNSKNTILSDL